MTKKAKILLIEDEAKIRKVVQTYLEVAGYDVRCAVDGVDGLYQAEIYRPDLVILDLNLPRLGGMEVAVQLTADLNPYIIMLTARSEEHDRIAGLKLGADDYLTKPFSPRELIARVEARLRRKTQEARPSSTDILRFKHLQIDPQQHRVWGTSAEIELTLTEYNLLWTLAKNAPNVLSREQLLTTVWGDTHHNDRIVDVYVNQVRRKVEHATGHPLIDTVRGIGYRFGDDPL